MGEGGRTLGRAVVTGRGALAREPADARQPVRGAHHEAGEIGCPRAGREALLDPAQSAAERRHVARSDAPAEGAQELAVGERPAGPRGADQEPLEPVQVDQGWPPSGG